MKHAILITTGITIDPCSDSCYCDSYRAHGCWMPGSLSYTPAPSYEVLWTLAVTPVVQPGLSTPCWRTSRHRAYYKPSTSLGGPGFKLVIMFRYSGLGFRV